LILIYILLGHRQQKLPIGFKTLVGILQSIQPWGMVEVFMLGVLVALIKLMNMAEIIPGVALWAFSGLTILLTVIISFDPRNFWQSELEMHQNKT
jgi:paraquat-inducible protein A